MLVPVLLIFAALIFGLAQLTVAGYLLFIVGFFVFGLILLVSVKLTACRRDVSVLKLIAQVLATASAYAVFYRMAPYVATAISLALPAAAAAIAELSWTEEGRTAAQLLESYRGWLIIWPVVFAAALIVSFVVPGEGITREAMLLWQCDDGETVKIFFPTVTNWKEPGNFWAGCAATASVCFAAVKYGNLARKAERERETARLVERRAREQMREEEVRFPHREESVPAAEVVGTNSIKGKMERICKVERKITLGKR